MALFFAGKKVIQMEVDVVQNLMTQGPFAVLLLDSVLCSQHYKRTRKQTQ